MNTKSSRKNRKSESRNCVAQNAHKTEDVENTFDKIKEDITEDILFEGQDCTIRSVHRSEIRMNTKSSRRNRKSESRNCVAQNAHKAEDVENTFDIIKEDITEDILFEGQDCTIQSVHHSKKKGVLTPQNMLGTCDSPFNTFFS